MLTTDQLADLAAAQDLARRFEADLVMIGATALLCYLDLRRYTRDVDLVVALDLSDFTAFTAELTASGWTRTPHLEHRWTAPRGSIVDLLPAGPELRKQRRLVWPGSGFEMNLDGFDHVFLRSAPFVFPGGLQCRVAPIPVVALLKIFAFLDSPYQRRKDLQDIRTVLLDYESQSPRLFGDDVFAAGLADFGLAGSFLLGRDLGAFVTPTEAQAIRTFAATLTLPAHDLDSLDLLDPTDRSASTFQHQLQALLQGLEVSLSLRS